MSAQLNPNNTFFLMRHGRDRSHLTSELNQSLAPNAYYALDDTYYEIADIVPKEIPLVILHGPTRRARQSAFYIMKRLIATGYLVFLEENLDIKEFYQGKFIVRQDLLIQGTYLPLELAWQVFNEKREAGEKDYRFGDPLYRNGQHTYPLLGEIFTEYGESQAEFLCRIRRFINYTRYTASLLGRIKIVITHQVVTSRLQRELIGKRVAFSHGKGAFVSISEL